MEVIPPDVLEQHRAAYDSAVARLRGFTTVTDFVRPQESRGTHPFVQSEMPEIRRDKFTEDVILSKDAFARAACDRLNPFGEADALAAKGLPKDLTIAIDTITTRGEAIVPDRAKRMTELEAIADSLEAMRNDCDRYKSPTSRAIAARFNVAWTAAVIDALGWPDKALAARYVDGFDVVFDIPDSGVFRAEDDPATISKAEFMANNTRMVKTISEEIERSAKSGDPDQVERRRQCWVRTKEEIDEGLVSKPRSRAQMDRRYGRGKWRCLGRNAIFQKKKWRCIDNGKRNKTNRATHMRERIVCGRADFPALVAREIARRVLTKRNETRAGRGVRKSRRMPRMVHGTDDLRAAYRHVPTRQPQFTNVAVWDADAGRVAYCDVPGHNFGLKSAVVNFNRFPELAAAAARRLLWVVTEHYYDDNNTCEPEYAQSSGQQCLVELCSEKFFGFPFDDDKHEEMDVDREYLGVSTSFERLDEGVILMNVTTKRRKKLRELVEEILAARELRSGMAASLFGKARFALSPCFGSVGKACLQPIMAREYQRSATAITQDIKDSLEFVQFLSTHLPPTELPLLPSALDPVVIFTDAEGKGRRERGQPGRSRTPSGHLGFVVYHPVYGRRYAHAAAPADWVRLFDAIKERDTYIGQYELAAALTPFLSLPDHWLRGRPVELWIDNSGAIGALIKGYSGVPDCARIVNMFHFAAAKAGVQSLWIDYVPSESNPADIPSRLHEMDESEHEAAVAQLGDLMPMTLPTFADADGEWLSSVNIASSVWRRNQ